MKITLLMALLLSAVSGQARHRDSNCAVLSAKLEEKQLALQAIETAGSYVKDLVSEADLHRLNYLDILTSSSSCLSCNRAAYLPSDVTDLKRSVTKTHSKIFSLETDIKQQIIGVERMFNLQCLN